MSERPTHKPYIGVTGISKLIEAEAIANAFSANLSPESTHTGMSGYLVSDRTLAGQDPPFPKYPRMKDLRELLTATRFSSLNAIHFRSRESSSLHQQIATLLNYGNLYADDLFGTIQLNMHWPPPHELDQIKANFPRLDLVLSLNSQALAEKRYTLADKLRQYRDTVSYVLIDPSGGIGRQINPEEVSPIFRTVSFVCGEKPIIFAGGLDDQNTVARLAQLYIATRTWNFGIDAEAGLRINKIPAVPHSGDLSIEKSVKYINNAAGLFNRKHSVT